MAKEKEIDLTSGHRIHVESWYISDDDAARSDRAKLLAEIKKNVGLSTATKLAVQPIPQPDYSM
ncbi:hypothetical protein FRC05_001477 [Tulasnella sp. 425]|nr:hypothetical protein FRC05_001477 [Tulasnella sp. 425]